MLCYVMLCYVIAVVILQTFYLGKLDLLTVYLGKLIFQNVTNFSQSKFYRLVLGCHGNNRDVSHDSYPKAIPRENSLP